MKSILPRELPPTSSSAGLRGVAWTACAQHAVTTEKAEKLWWAVAFVADA
jgi:hypothetical protein